jgi:hypothetical protein
MRSSHDQVLISYRCGCGLIRKIEEFPAMGIGLRLIGEMPGCQWNAGTAPGEQVERFNEGDALEKEGRGDDCAA